MFQSEFCPAQAYWRERYAVLAERMYFAAGVSAFMASLFLLAFLEG